VTVTTETFSYSYDGESFHGEFASREEAIEETRAGRVEPETRMYTRRNGPKPQAREFRPGLDSILDEMDSNAFQNYDEGADSRPAALTKRAGSPGA
jgi:hypothetical protein